ncbi:hypothetical protein N665_2317s0005 [Sinapis alba]|nr:hypothetical protein N665_2317s0005 [Sinapis alba]
MSKSTKILRTKAKEFRGEKKCVSLQAAGYDICVKRERTQTAYATSILYYYTCRFLIFVCIFLFRVKALL